LTTLLGHTLATSVFPVFKKVMLAFWAFPFRIWRSRGGHHIAMNSLADMFEGDLTLLADVPQFCPTTSLPDCVKYVGPILWNAPMPLPAWFKQLDPNRRTIYVSMGSSGKKEFFSLCHEAFLGSDYQVLMTTGEIDFSVDEATENFHVIDFAPGAALMRHSDVVICHGGNGTIYQALANGTPIIGIPTHIDQQLQMQLCERWDVGVKLRQKGITAENIRRAVDSIMENPSYRTNAESFQKAVSAYDGAKQAAYEIEKFLGR